MPAFTSTPAPSTTLWGVPNKTTQRLPGLWFVTTPSHGGFVLSEERQAAMPESLRLDSVFYEEHVNWSLAVLAFEDELEAAGDPLFDIERTLAHQTARTWRTDRYRAFADKAVETRDSHVLRAIRAYEALIGQIVVRAAWGDWAEWVPKGKVGLIGQKVSAVDHLGFTSYEGPDVRGLCDEGRYDSAAGPHSFEAIGAEIIP